MKKTTILDFRLFGYYIIFETNDDSISKLICKLYSSIINNRLTLTENIRHKKITLINNGTTITAFDGKQKCIVEEFEIVDFLIDVINNSFDLFEKDKYIYLHGSVVANNNKCILFIAPTMQGKTTLCTQMVLKGYTYLSDDLIILDKQCRLYPFISPIKFRNNIMLDAAETSNVFNRIETNTNIVLSCVELPSFKINYVPEKVILLSRNNDHKPFEAKKISGFDSLNKLIRNAAFIENSKNHIFVSKKLSECTDIYDISYNSYEEIIEFLQEI